MFRILLAVILVSINLFAEDPQKDKIILRGDPRPGSLIIGKAYNPESVVFNGIPIRFDKSGVFIIGFDRDDKGEFELRVRHKDGTKTIKTITLRERTFKTQSITVDEKYVEPPAELTARIKEESRQIRQAREKVFRTDSAYYLSGFLRPLKQKVRNGVFGSQRILNGKPANVHNGVDIGAPTGTKIKALSDGIVLFRGDDFYYGGNLTILDHGHGLTSTYLHMSEILVNQGDIIKKGDIVGKVGSTGRSTGPHLHLGTQWYDKRIDPLEVLKLNVDFE